MKCLILKPGIVYSHYGHSMLKQCRYEKWIKGGQDALVDSRRVENLSNVRRGCVPPSLRALIDDFLMRLIASGIELDTNILQPFIKAFIRTVEDGKWEYVLQKKEGDKRYFKCSRSWIRSRLRATKKSWRKCT